MSIQLWMYVCSKKLMLLSIHHKSSQLIKTLSAVTIMHLYFSMRYLGDHVSVSDKVLEELFFKGVNYKLLASVATMNELTQQLFSLSPTILKFLKQMTCNSPYLIS